jgi:hypothetical protein
MAEAHRSRNPAHAGRTGGPFGPRAEGPRRETGAVWSLAAVSRSDGNTARRRIRDQAGVPGIGLIPVPFKIVQMPRLILILYEDNTTFRQIFLDGRRLAPDPEPRFMGYSTGRWDRDTLIVDTVGLNDRNWLDRMGHPHSDAVHVIERFRRRDAGHLEIEVTIDDPKAYTKPITYTQRQTLLPDEDLLEYFCSENEKDVARYR